MSSRRGYKNSEKNIPKGVSSSLWRKIADCRHVRGRDLIALHPGRLTWNLQITHLEKKRIFQTSMIMFHVNLPGCTCLSNMSTLCTSWTEWTTDQPNGVLSPGRVEKLGARNVFLLVAGLWRLAQQNEPKRWIRGIWGSGMYIAVTDSRVGCVHITLPETNSKSTAPEHFHGWKTNKPFFLGVFGVFSGTKC